jgi:hypothetical protein
MSHLDPAKLHVRFLPETNAEGPFPPRRYTLTHSDRTGELFLTIGSDYDRKQIAGLYTRVMRDEVLAEWRTADLGGETSLHVHVHVSGGPTVGSARWRDGILRKHMPNVLEALRAGDALLYRARPFLDRAPVFVHFHSHRADLDRVQGYGVVCDHRIDRGEPAALDRVA